MSLSAAAPRSAIRGQPGRARLTFAWGTAELLPPAPYSIRYHAAAHTVGLTLERQVGSHAFASDRCEPFDAWANTLAFTPRAMDVFSESPQGGEYLLLHVEPSVFLGILEQCGPHGVAFRRVTRTGHERAGWLGRQIRKNLLAGASALETEHLLLELIATSAEMLAEDGRWLRARCPTPPRVDRRYIAKVIDFVEGHLEEPLSLSRLGDLVGLSPLQLLRAFRAYLGTTPHAYLRERRVLHARTLLARTQMPIADIALCCGFSGQAHLTSTMHQLLGCTPGVLRQNSRVSPCP